MPRVSLRWIEDKMMTVSDSNGHSIVVGRSPDPQFDWVGVKPADLLLMSVAACTAYDVVDILQKQREPLEDINVVCEGEYTSEPPYRFSHIHVDYHVKGDVSPDKLERAIRLSEEKYCSVMTTLKVGTTFSSNYEIKEK